MSVAEILHQIETLPSEERLRLFEQLAQRNEAEVPESLRQSMAEADRGDLIDLDDALQELDR
jgi:Mg/Co/Ni transporter MgtE